MPDSVSIEIDPGGNFQRELERKLLTSSRTFADVLNQTILNVAGRALNETPMADKSEIERQLGVIGHQLKVFKSGKRKGKFGKGKKIYAQSEKTAAPLAALIINARRAKEGKKGLRGKEMEKAIRQMVGSRKRSVGFNRTGYIPGIRAVASKLKSPFIIGRLRGISVVGQPKGRGIPAAASLNPTAWVINSVKSILEIKGGTDALRRAFAAEAVEMKRHYEEKMQKVLN